MKTKQAALSTKCVCGSDVNFKIGKPTRFDPTIAKVSCKCGSRYMFSCIIDKQTGQPNLEAHILELSRKAKAITKKSLLAQKDAATEAVGQL